MPLTTRHQDGRRIDSTNEEQWAEVHVAGYTQLFCPECTWRMHAVDGGEARVRHFAHNAGRPNTCSLTASESAEHLATKAAIAAAVRELNGWTAEIEFPGEGWRADVLATSPSGVRRIAFEPQFSTIHESKAVERTERHRAAGLETIWLDAKGQGSLAPLPTTRLFYGADKIEVGIQRIDLQGKRASWRSSRLTLDGFVRHVCLSEISHDRFWAWETDRQAWRDHERDLARRRAEAARLAEALVEFNRKHVAAQEEQRRRDEQLYAEQAEQRRREDEERRAREAEEQREREAERERALGPWHIRSGASNEDVLALAARYSVAEKPFPEWISIGDRLHAVLSARGLLHD